MTTDRDMEILIEADGTVSFIYSDDVAELFADEETIVRRASFVEPADGGWTADMGPIGYAVKLGPYRTRHEALNAERAFLVRYLDGEMGLGPRL